MKKLFTLKYKFIFVNLFLVITPVVVVSMLSQNQFTKFANNTTNEAYQALYKLGIENMKAGVETDYQKIQNFVNTASTETLKLSASSNISALLNTRAIADKEIEMDARHQLSLLLKTCTIHKELIQERVNISLAVAENLLKLNAPAAELDENLVVKWKAVNQFTLDEYDIELNSMKYGDLNFYKCFTFNTVSPIVDKVGSLCNVTCTIFQKMNAKGDMLRISTNVKKLDGNRAVGTYIPAINPDGSANPVVSALMNDTIFRGRAYVVNNWYLTAYKPIKDYSGTIIGAIYVGIIKENEHLLEAIENIKMKNNGYAFVLNENGQIRIHQKKDLKHKHILNDLKISEFKKVIADKQENIIGSIRYVYEKKNIITYYLYFKDWDWYICVSFSIDDREKELRDAAEIKIKNEFKSIIERTKIRINGKAQKVYSQIRLLDNKGQEVISCLSGKIPAQLKSYNEQLWFQDSLSYFENNSELTFNSGVGISDNTGVEEMRIVSPVNHNNTRKGFIVVNLDWRLAWKLLKNHAYGQSGYAFIINHTGEVLSHPEHSFKDHVNFSESQFGELSTIVKEKMLMNKSESEKYQLHNVQNIIYFMPLKIGNEQYSIAATTPANEFLKIAQEIKINAKDNFAKTKSIVIIGIVVSVLVAIIIGFLISRSINNPLMKVIQFSKQVSEGDLSQKLDINRNDELGEMANSLNNMVSKQQQLIKLSNLKKLNTPIIEIDKDFNLTFVNDAFCKVTGRTDTECIGKKCYELIRTDSCQTKNCSGNKAIVTKNNVRFEYRAEIGMMKNMPIISTYIPIENKGIVESAICFIVDQTDIYEIIDEVRLVTNRLNQSSEQFEELSQKMSDSANNVASYSELSSDNVRQISDAGEEIARNIDSEVSSIKEMSQSLSKISDFTKKAKQISLKASEHSQDIANKMESMSLTSEEIGKTIVVIDEIADRTDLLALNAAIEAESAGSAGKGFAVVADEVQKLAKQSSDATNDITRQIANVQKSTKDVLHAIEIINSTIEEVTSFNTDIASAVEILNQTVSEILESVDHTSQKAFSISDGVSQSYKMSSDITTVSKESATIAEDINNASRDMSLMAGKLLEIVNRFKL